jgi:hypothetical protein
MVLTVSFALSPVIGLCCHRRLADIGVSGPLGLTSPSARLERQRRGVRTTRLRRPPQAPFVVGTIRVHRIPPHVRDDRETPLWKGGMAGVVILIWGEREAEYFCRQDWTGQISLIRHDKSGCRRTAIERPPGGGS